MSATHRCPACGEAVSGDAVNAEHGAATCPACNTAFALRRRAPAPERHIALPKGFTIESGEPPLRPAGSYRDPGSAPLPELVVRRRWFRWQVLFLTAFAVVWNAFLLTWYAGVIGTGSLNPVALCFPLIHVGVGVGITYYAAALWLNSTELRIHEGQLTVRHGPLPWRGNCEIPVADIQQLLHERKVRRRKNGSQESWEVHARTYENDYITLMRGLSSAREARYVEWVVEEHLGIEDDPSQNLP